MDVNGVPNADAVNVQLSALIVPPALDKAPMPVIVELLIFSVPVELLRTENPLTLACALIAQLFSVDTPLFCNPLALYVPPEIVQLLAVNVPDAPTNTHPWKLFEDVLSVQLFKTAPPDDMLRTQETPFKFPNNDEALIVSVPEPVIFTQFMLFVAELPTEALVNVALPEAEYVRQVAFPH